MLKKHKRILCIGDQNSEKITTPFNNPPLAQLNDSNPIQIRLYKYKNQIYQYIALTKEKKNRRYLQIYIDFFENDIDILIYVFKKNAIVLNQLKEWLQIIKKSEIQLALVSPQVSYDQQSKFVGILNQNFRVDVINKIIFPMLSFEQCEHNSLMQRIINQYNNNQLLKIENFIRESNTISRLRWYFKRNNNKKQII